MSDKINILFILADQLRASSLPVYGEQQIETPNLDRLASEGVVFSNAISSCPLCTPYRGMLLTGRYPQTTGMLVNFIRIRHDEIGIGDTFSHASYRTAWIGKWHLHSGAFPEFDSYRDYVPEGRDRLGFQFWRAYNFHTNYFNGWVGIDDWWGEHWGGYETNALTRYAFRFLDAIEDEPFCLFISPHQPHNTTFGTDRAPEEYYARLHNRLALPDNVPDGQLEAAQEMYRHYLAMILALDDMVGDLLAYLDRTGRADNTLVVFASDHGTQGGAHGWRPWRKRAPYEESIRVPLIMRLPGVIEGGVTRDTLVAPTDLFPSLCGLCGISTPRTVEGFDLSRAWRGTPGAPERKAILAMNFTGHNDRTVDGDPSHLEGQEWRAVRTKQHVYIQWLDGEVELFDVQRDPLQLDNLAALPEMEEVRSRMAATLTQLMAERNDELVPGSTYADWLDNYRRIVRNVHGPLGDPEGIPDWSLLS